MYQLTHTSTVKRLSDSASIPSVEGNSDYAKYLAWVAQGNTALPAPVVPLAVPTVVTMRQARLALLGAGLLGSIDAAINALESPAKEAARIEWEYSQEVSRTQPFVQLLAPALGLSEEELDELFTAASQL